jgi:hypothetical protein
MKKNATNKIEIRTFIRKIVIFFLFKYLKNIIKMEYVQI